MTVEATTEPHVLPAEEERLAANLAALKSKAPHLHSRLCAVRKTHAELIVDDDGGIDLDLMGQRFYGGDALAHAERQLDDFFSKPLRNFLHQPDPVKLFGSVGASTASCLFHSLGLADFQHIDVFRCLR